MLPDLTHTHSQCTHSQKEIGDASGYTYRYKLPIPFGGRLVLRRQERKGFGGTTNRESSTHVKDQIQ